MVCCVVHENKYDDDNIGEIRTITENNEVRLREAKLLHEKGTDEAKKILCNLFHDVIDRSEHGTHYKCFKSFTRIVWKRPRSSYRTNSVSPTPVKPRLSTRLSSPASASASSSKEITSKDLFPKECCFCNKVYKKVSSKKKAAIVITTHDAEATIKAYAREKNPTWFAEIRETDLIAKELRYHIACYRSQTLGFSQKKIDKSAILSSDNIKNTNFEIVKDYINNHVLSMNMVVSMNTLLDMCGGCYKNKLKSRMTEEFPGKLIFFQPSGKECEVVISASVSSLCNTPVSPKQFIKKTAEYLRQDILLYQVRSMKTSWLPTVEELSGVARDFPESLMEFFISLFFEDKRHQPNDYTSIPRLIDSYMADMIHAVTRGKVMTAKHFVLGMGLHNMTRSKKLIELVNKLGHCIDYNAV